MTNEYSEFQELKHKNNKEILSIKEQMAEKAYQRKMEFVTYLYKLKNEYLQAEEKSHIKKIMLLHGEKEVKVIEGK